MNEPKFKSKRLSLPVTRIRKLANMAIELGLQSLEVGDVKIVPGPRMEQPPQPGQKSLSERVRGATWADGSPLSVKHQNDLILFGDVIDDRINGEEEGS